MFSSIINVALAINDFAIQFYSYDFQVRVMGPCNCLGFLTEDAPVPEPEPKSKPRTNCPNMADGYSY